MTETLSYFSFLLELYFYELWQYLEVVCTLCTLRGLSLPCKETKPVFILKTKANSVIYIYIYITQKKNRKEKIFEKKPFFFCTFKKIFRIGWNMGYDSTKKVYKSYPGTNLLEKYGKSIPLYCPYGCTV